MMLGILAFGFEGCGNRPLEKVKINMTNLEKQLEENAKLGIRAVEFPKGLDWFNVAKPLQMESLKGKVVLLDFWTFCCINCMHVIPELKRLEAKYPTELVVVGVHSAKFANERDSGNIRQSILRYEVHHPVVNDPGLTLWQAYGVHAWPTLVLVDSEGHVVLSVSGEGHYDLLDRAIGTLIQRAQSEGKLASGSIPMALEETNGADNNLKFPGKIFADGKNLVVADSNHNRILVLDHLGNILEVIGSGQEGSSDGNFEQAEFNHPQGVFREGNSIYAADTENHLIRLIDLKEKTVETIAGTGVRGGYLHGKALALKTPLSSPWDLVKVEDHLYIAMAGAHQIWKLDLKNSELDLFVGSGREDIVDGSGTSSALAQPSGITFDGDRTFYFADSEVSAVRKIDLKSREVETLIGQGLFDFGDQDGLWSQAVLQHPLGVHYLNGIIYVADTYNDKIKAVHLKDKKINTLTGSSEHGLQDGKPGALYAPGGLSAAGGNLFIADTNNHAVRVLNLASGKLSTLQVKERQPPNAKIVSGSEANPFSAETRIETSPLSLTGFRPEGEPSRKNPFLKTLIYPAETLAENARGSVGVLLPKDHEFTENEPLQFQIRLKEDKATQNLKEGSLSRPVEELPITFELSNEAGTKVTLEVDLEVPYCTTVSPKLCKYKSLKLIQPISFKADGRSKLELRPQIQS